MKTTRFLVALIALLGWTSGPTNAQTQRAPLNAPATPPAINGAPSTELARANEALRAHTPVFIENRGQWDSQAKFLLRSPGLDLWITGNGVVYDLNRVERVEKKSDRNGPRLASTMRENAPDNARAPEVRVTRAPVFISFEGASSGAAAVGGGQLPEYHNYLIGNDPSKWAEHVRLYSDARVQGLYRGIDAVFYLDEGRPRYDLVVAPGADPSRISMKVEGSTGVSVTSSGALRIGTTLGTIEQRELFAYQQIDGEKRQVRCAFVAEAGGRVRFDLGRYDRSRPLVIDPLVYSTYLGGGVYEIGEGIAVDGSGNAYVTGQTWSTNFPTLNASQTSNAGGWDVFVTKLTSSGARDYSTYLGGSDHDYGNDIAVDGSGNAYVAGRTGSTNFPTLNASQTSNAGGGDAFVTKLTSSGALSYSTYLGGDSTDEGRGIAVDCSGNAYVTGRTGSTNFPTLNASQTSNAGTSNAFVTKLLDPGTIGVIAPASGSALRASAYLLAPLPNPTATTTSFQIHLDRRSTIDLFITDQSGRVIDNVACNESFEAGEHLFVYSTTGLGSGSYYITLRSPSGIETKRLIVVR